MIKDMDMENINGMMEESIEENGRWESNMVQDTLLMVTKRERVYGRKERGLNGPKKTKEKSDDLLNQYFVY